MKKINFTNILIETSIGEFSVMDLSKDLGDYLFRMATDLEMDMLARKIYNSFGTIEISDSLFEKMLSIMENGVAFRVIQGIKQHVEKEQNDTK